MSEMTPREKRRAKDEAMIDAIDRVLDGAGEGQQSREDWMSSHMGLPPEVERRAYETWFGTGETPQFRGFAAFIAGLEEISAENYSRGRSPDHTITDEDRCNCIACRITHDESCDLPPDCSCPNED